MWVQYQRFAKRSEGVRASRQVRQSVMFLVLLCLNASSWFYVALSNGFTKYPLDVDGTGDMLSTRAVNCLKVLRRRCSCGRASRRRQGGGCTPPARGSSGAATRTRR